MGRKRKIDMEGSSKSSLPPCRVCGAPGAGFHYGVNTCEACKGFFHRSLKMKTPYRCDSGSTCAIEHGHHKLCQHCRYLKCLAVGMAKEAIKTGRYTTMKRTNDILEIKRLEQKQPSISQTESVTRQNCVQTEPMIKQTCVVQNTNFLGKKCEIVQNFEIQNGKCSLPSGNINGHLPAKTVSQVISEEPDSIIFRNCSLLDTAEQESGSQISHLCARTSKVKTLDISDTCVRTSNIQSCDNLSSLNEIIFSESSQEDSQDYRLFQDHRVSQVHCSAIPEPLLKTTCHLSAGSMETVQPTHHHDVSTHHHISSHYHDVSSSSPASSLRSTHMPFSPSSPSSSSSSHMLPLISPSDGTSVSSSASLLSPSDDVLATSACVQDVSSSPHSPQSFKSHMSQSLQHTADSLCMTSQICVPLGSTTDVTGNTSDVTECVAPLVGSVSEWYIDKSLIVKKLLEADENFMVPLYGRMSEAEMKRQHQEHFETCRLQREMFGQLPRLPDHEYDYIFVTTGLDTDDRQKRLHMLGVYLEKMIRAMVNFCKAIPGFCLLSITDKVKLIKYSRQEFFLFIIYKFIDSERRILRGFDNQWKCENELSRMSTDSEFEVVNQSLDLHFKFCTSLQNLKLSDEELVVIRALIVMAPDRDEPVLSPLAWEIYVKLSECLVQVLSQRHQSPLMVYAKIVDRMTEARSQTEGLISHFRKLKMDKYSDLMKNPLLREMCAGVFFDYKDDDFLLNS